MRLPNKEIIIAILESYLGFRVSSWGLDKDYKNDQLTELAKYKLKTCGEIILIAEKAQTLDDWINFLHVVAKKIETESEKVSAGWGRSILGMFVKTDLLLETLRAVFSCVLSQLKSDEIDNQETFKQFKEIVSRSKADFEKLNQEEKKITDAKGVMTQTFKHNKEKLRKEILNLENKELATHVKYFKEVTMAWDAVRVKQLKEGSFQDYQHNVMKKERKVDEKLLTIAKQLVPSSPSTVPVIKSEPAAKAENPAKNVENNNVVPIFIPAPATPTQEKSKPTYAQVLESGSVAKSQPIIISPASKSSALKEDEEERLPEESEITPGSPPKKPSFFRKPKPKGTGRRSTRRQQPRRAGLGYSINSDESI